MYWCNILVFHFAGASIWSKPFIVQPVRQVRIDTAVSIIATTINIYRTGLLCKGQESVKEADLFQNIYIHWRTCS